MKTCRETQIYRNSNKEELSGGLVGGPTLLVKEKLMTLNQKSGFFLVLKFSICSSENTKLICVNSLQVPPLHGVFSVEQD